MSDFSGTPGKRTEYTAAIIFSEREKEALERFLNRCTVEGDVSLVENVIGQVLDTCVKE